MDIQRSDSGPKTKGSIANFTGSVTIHTPFTTEAPGRVVGAIVSFEAGARSAWHTHPLGQTLVVISGVGWTQFEGGPVQEIRPGDVISCAPGRKHWHGASATSAMSHVAINEALDGKAVDWLDLVSDEEYRAAERSANDVR